MFREPRYRIDEDQHVVEVPCEMLPGGALNAFVACHQESGLWYVTDESKADGKVIAEVGKHGTPMLTVDPTTGRQLPDRHFFHVKLMDHRQEHVAQGFDFAGVKAPGTVAAKKTRPQ